MISTNVAPAKPINITQIKSVTPVASVPPKGSFWGGVTAGIENIAGITNTVAGAYSTVKSAISTPQTSVTPTVVQLGQNGVPSQKGGLNTPVLPNTYVTVNPDGTKRLIDDRGDTLTVAKNQGTTDYNQIAIVAGILAVAGFFLMKGGK